jgi:hypothetical protein
MLEHDRRRWRRWWRRRKVGYRNYWAEYDAVAVRPIIARISIIAVIAAVSAIGWPGTIASVTISAMPPSAIGPWTITLGNRWAWNCDQQACQDQA